MRIVVLSALLLVFTIAGPAAGGGKKAHPEGRDYELTDDDRAWVERVQMSMNAARRRLKTAHDQALADPGLQRQLENLRVAMEDAMIHLDPSAEPTVRERYEVFGEIVRLQKAEPVSAENAKRLNELNVEYDRLSRQLGELPGRAKETVEVKQKQEAYVAALHAKMTAIDPDVPKLLELQDQLVEEFLSYRDRMLGRHDGEAVAPERAPQAGETP